MLIRDWFKDRHIPILVLHGGLVLGGLAFLSLIIVYAYQGWFTRYMADDFCNAVLFSTDALGGLALRYTSGFGGNRYSNIWLVGLSEIFGAKSVTVLPALHLALWVIGLVWAMAGIKKSLKMDWPFAMTVFLGLSIAFFTLLQVPNRYQSVYWRSSMTTHFAPVVYGTFLLAYLMGQSQKAVNQPLPFRSRLIVFVSAFLVGGFSEPADAIQITVLILVLIFAWRGMRPPARLRVFKLLSWALAGALLSLVVMIVSPANELRLGEPPGFAEFVTNTVLYTFTFIFSTFGPLPLPSILSVLIPALLFWLYGQMNDLQYSQEQKRRLWFVVLIAPVITYVLIAASFSPSVYGQGYPVERMRFSARWIMTTCLLLEGALLGLLISQARFRLGRPAWYVIFAGLFSVTAILYPLRAAWIASMDIPEYRQRAKLWDARDRYMRRHIALGEADIVVPELPGVYKVKEWDVRENHWVNRCAAQYYGANSIRTVPVPDEILLELFNE